MLKGNRIPLYNRDTMNRWIRAKRFSESEVAQFRLKVINSLIPKSRRPKRLRKMMMDHEIVSSIRNIREEHSRIGKEKIKPLLDEYCSRINIKTVSVSSIGKIIKNYDLRFPSSSIRGKYRKKVKHSPKHNKPGYIEIDTIVKFIYGMKLYIYNAVDINSRFQFSHAFESANSKNTVKFIKELEEVYPRKNGIITVQTDNGSEYLGAFDQHLKTKHIKHLFIYPRCPRINGYVERSNRTLQEEFLNNHLNLLATNTKAFNSKLTDYLIWYNTKRVHKGLNNLSPIDFLLKYYPESQMYVTHTFP